MKIIKKRHLGGYGKGAVIHFDDDSYMTIEGATTGEVNYFFSGNNLVWREKGGGWTFAGNDLGFRYPCRLAAVVAFKFNRSQ